MRSETRSLCPLFPLHSGLGARPSSFVGIRPELCRRAERARRLDGNEQVFTECSTTGLLGGSWLVGGRQTTSGSIHYPRSTNALESHVRHSSSARRTASRL